MVALLRLPPLQAQSATAPTASQDPAAIDQAWQKASNKYDSARAALLKDVDSVNQQGPFRADWESLQQFEAPEWYKDAKFGIFIHWARIPFQPSAANGIRDLCMRQVATNLSITLRPTALRTSSATRT